MGFQKKKYKKVKKYSARMDFKKVPALYNDNNGNNNDHNSNDGNNE